MQPISFAERLVTALVSIVASALTLLALPWFASAIGGNSESFQLYDWIFSKLGIFILIISAIAGFLLGSEKMVNTFSFFWGTHSIWDEEWFQKIVIGLFALFAIGLVLHIVFK